MRAAKPFFDLLADARAYVYFLRDFWDGGGADVVMWWQGPDGVCRHFCSVTGETDNPEARGEVRADSTVDCEAFLSLLQKLVDGGALELRDDPDAFVFSNSTDLVAVKDAEARTNSWRIKTGATHRDPREPALFERIARAAPSYWSDL